MSWYLPCTVCSLAVRCGAHHEDEGAHEQYVLCDGLPCGVSEAEPPPLREVLLLSLLSLLLLLLFDQVLLIAPAYTGSSPPAYITSSVCCVSWESKLSRSVESKLSRPVQLSLWLLRCWLGAPWSMGYPKRSHPRHHPSLSSAFLQIFRLRRLQTVLVEKKLSR